MFRVFLRIVLAILLVRFLGGLFRAIAGGSRPEPGERFDPRVGDASAGRGRRVPQPPTPLVDRASAIDVPFTEERQEG
jgi:hypothetical protein